MLKDIGFIINPYERCVANTIVDGKQCTVIWYVDDLKVSNEDEKVVRSTMDTINTRCPGLICNVFKEHIYLGMQINFNEDTSVTIDMKDYVKETTAVSEMSICRNAASPAKRDLFDIYDKSNLLEQHTHDNFQHCIAKLLYVSQRCQLDIHLCVSFVMFKGFKTHGGRLE